MGGPQAGVRIVEKRAATISCARMPGLTPGSEDSSNTEDTEVHLQGARLASVDVDDGAVAEP